MYIFTRSTVSGLRRPALRGAGAATLARAEELCRVPEDISRTMADYTKDGEDIIQRREAVAEMIEELAP